MPPPGDTRPTLLDPGFLAWACAFALALIGLVIALDVLGVRWRHLLGS